MIKKILLAVVGVVVLAALGIGGFAFMQISAFDESMAKKYDVPVGTVALTTDPVMLERGKHLAESLGSCNDCHGANYGGGKSIAMGPLGTVKFPNITTGKNGKLSEYADGELFRLLKHGLRKDGTSVRFMPAGDFAWWPDEDVAALISHLRTLPPVDGEPGNVEIGALGKVLDRMDKVPFDVARRIDHANLPKGPVPSESPEYGAYVGKLCTGCHGATLSGGPIPGAPPEFPLPLNLTSHETGLKEWSYADFNKLLTEGVRKNGKKLDPFMPMESFKNMNDTEKKALFAYLQSVPAKPLGGR